MYKGKIHDKKKLNPISSGRRHSCTNELKITTILTYNLFGKNFKHRKRRSNYSTITHTKNLNEDDAFSFEIEILTKVCQEIPS